MLCTSFYILLLLTINSITVKCALIPSDVTSKSQLSGPSNDFGLRFLEQINSNEINKNVLFSPLSILLSYGMLLEGSSGQTKDQIIQVLRFSSVSNDKTIIGKESKKLLEEYKSAENGQRNFSLVTSNLMLVNNAAELRKSYTSAVQNNYLAEVINEDFTKGDALITRLNSWVTEKTHGKIKELLSSALDPSSALILINTVYFKGTWRFPFEKELTEDATFHNSDGTESQVKMMYHFNDYFKFTKSETKNLKIVELPYNGDISMMFILPTESNNLTNLVSTLDSMELLNLLRSMKTQRLETLGIPKFKLEDNHKLDKILPKMGLNLPFSDKAELPGIVENGINLQVSESLQKTFLTVDEAGSEAAAATSLAVSRSIPPSTPSATFIADRPFLFIIYDNKLDVNLFMGQVNKTPVF